MAVFAMEAASIISERSLEISFASALSTVSSSGVNVNAGKPLVACPTFFLTQFHVLRHGDVLPTQQWCVGRDTCSISIALLILVCLFSDLLLLGKRTMVLGSA